MAQYTYAQLEQLWIQAGGGKLLAPLMAAIALAESSGNSDAINPVDNNGTQTSVGLWQVSSGSHNYPSSWLTPLGNAQEAVAKLNTQGITAWGTYNSGAYKQFLQGEAPPPGSVALGGQVTQPGSGGLGGWVASIFENLAIPGLGGLAGVVGSASSVAQSIAGLAAPLIKIAEAIDWFFHPAHWIRLFAGLAGGILVLFGIWQMSHAGGA